MKTCPNCNTQYTDDTLRYCLQDGAPLVPVQSTQQPVGSFDALDPEREQLRESEPSDSVDTLWTPQAEVPRVSEPRQATRSRFRFVIGVALAALVVFLLGAAAAIGFWLYSRPSDVAVGNSVNGNGNRNVTATPTPTPRVVLSPSPTYAPANQNNNGRPPDPEITPQPTVDKEQVASEVSEEIRGWISSSESGDLSGIMSRYAPSVDYYRRSGADRGLIRADKQRAFRAYDSITFRVSNMNISVSDSGETATALFDKEWHFTGRSPSSGKVQQELRFRRINGQWLITGERDLKVYYTN